MKAGRHGKRERQGGGDVGEKENVGLGIGAVEGKGEKADDRSGEGGEAGA